MKNPRGVLIFADNGGIAQLVERLVRNEKARGSNPLTSSLRHLISSRKVSSPLAANGSRLLRHLTREMYRAQRL
jgi:hypothetical protein